MIPTDTLHAKSEVSFTFLSFYYIIRLEINDPQENQKGCDPMKLIYVIVRNIDSGDVTHALNKQGFYVTKLASTGGFLREGNTTLMIGTDADKVEEVIDIVKNTCGPRKQIISNPIGPGEYAAMNVVVNVGGATIFVTEVDRFEKI
jgi:uncharacterized protein YaaQ